MKKSDLRTGMWVKYRNDDMAMVLLNSKNSCSENDVLTDGKSWRNLDSYTDDLKSFIQKKEDVIEVWWADRTTDMIKFSEDNFGCIWKREEIQYLTQNEAERILSETLGKKVEIRRSLNERN